MSFLTIAWLGGSLFGYMFRSTGDRFCTWTLRFETWGSHSNVGEAVEGICLLASFLVWKKLKEKKRYQQVCLHQNSEDLPSQLQGTSKYSFVPPFFGASLERCTKPHFSQQTPPIFWGICISLDTVSTLLTGTSHLIPWNFASELW